MKKIFMMVLLLTVTYRVIAQVYAKELQDCNYEKDEIFINWDNDVNQRYAEKNSVKKFNKKRLRSFYCQNLVARNRLESDGYVQSEGSFQLSDDDEKYLVFSIKMGDLIYQDKLYIHIGPSQKLISKR